MIVSEIYNGSGLGNQLWNIIAPRCIAESIINFAFQTNTYNCSTTIHFPYYNTDMHVSININCSWVLTSPTIKRAIMKLRTQTLVDRVIIACKNNI